LLFSSFFINILFQRNKENEQLKDELRIKNKLLNEKTAEVSLFFVIALGQSLAIFNFLIFKSLSVKWNALNR